MNSLSKSLSEKCIAIYVTITVFDIEGAQKGKTTAYPVLRDIL
jgi:hypothetical protein